MIFGGQIIYMNKLQRQEAVGGSRPDRVKATLQVENGVNDGQRTVQKNS